LAERTGAFALCPKKYPGRVPATVTLTVRRTAGSEHDCHTEDTRNDEAGPEKFPLLGLRRQVRRQRGSPQHKAGHPKGPTRLSVIIPGRGPATVTKRALKVAAATMRANGGPMRGAPPEPFAYWCLSAGPCWRRIAAVGLPGMTAFRGVVACFKVRSPLSQGVAEWAIAHGFGLWDWSVLPIVADACPGCPRRTGPTSKALLNAPDQLLVLVQVQALCRPLWTYAGWRAGLKRLRRSAGRPVPQPETVGDGPLGHALAQGGAHLEHATTPRKAVIPGSPTAAISTPAGARTQAPVGNGSGGAPRIGPPLALMVAAPTFRARL